MERVLKKLLCHRIQLEMMRSHFKNKHTHPYMLLRSAIQIPHFLSFIFSSYVQRALVKQSYRAATVGQIYLFSQVDEKSASWFEALKANKITSSEIHQMCPHTQIQKCNVTKDVRLDSC